MKPDIPGNEATTDEQQAVPDEAVEAGANTPVDDTSDAGEHEQAPDNIPVLLMQDDEPDTAMSTDTVDIPDKRARSVRNYWTVAALFVVSAAIFSFVIGSYLIRAKQSEELASKLSEIDAMKQQISRMHEQKEAIQRERDSALATVQAEQQKRKEQVQAALEASKREIEAMTAAALAAEEAVKAAQQAEDLATKKSIEKERLRAERERIERERLQAELEKQRLEQEQKQAELEKELLELEKARQEKLTQEENQKRIAKEQAELFQALEEKEAATTAANKSPEQKTQDKQSFSTDPCSSPSAKFLSTCK